MFKLKIGILVSVLLLTVCSYGQLTQSYNNLGHYELLKITSRSGSVIILKDANIGFGEITAAGKTIPFDQVTRLQYKVGDSSMAMAIGGYLAGTLVGVLVALNTIKTVEDYGDEDEETTTIETWPMYAFGIGGCLIGYATGKESPKYRTMFDKEAGIGMLENNLHLDLSLGNRYNDERNIFVGLRYNF
jgi:hypothetical protein